VHLAREDFTELGADLIAKPIGSESLCHGTLRGGLDNARGAATPRLMAQAPAAQAVGAATSFSTVKSSITSPTLMSL
jgi:hypothetical protein